MTKADELFVTGDAAEEAGEFGVARFFFQQGSALGCDNCLGRLAHLYDVGIGVEIDKAFAMRCYRKAWRLGGKFIYANNIAILYREQGDLKAMVRWYKRAIERGDEDARVQLAKCYLHGIGVRKSVSAAALHLRIAIKAEVYYDITEAGREEAESLLRAIEGGSSPTGPLPLPG